MNSAQIKGLKIGALMEVIRKIPEGWWRNNYNEIRRCAGHLRPSGGGRMKLLSDLAVSISAEIGRWAKKEHGASPGVLVNCTASEERILTFNIPISAKGETYMIRLTARDPDLYDLSMYHPSATARDWYGPIAAGLKWELPQSGAEVTVEGHRVTAGVWVALCALWGTPAVGLILDMATDGVV